MLGNGATLARNHAVRLLYRFAHRQGGEVPERSRVGVLCVLLHLRPVNSKTSIPSGFPSFLHRGHEGLACSREQEEKDLPQFPDPCPANEQLAKSRLRVLLIATPPAWETR